MDRIANAVETDNVVIELLMVNFFLVPTLLLCLAHDVFSTPIVLMTAGPITCLYWAVPQTRFWLGLTTAAYATLVGNNLHMCWSAQGWMPNVGLGLMVLAGAWYARSPLQCSSVDKVACRVLLYLATLLIAWAYSDLFEAVHPVDKGKEWDHLAATHLWI